MLKNQEIHIQSININRTLLIILSIFVGTDSIIDVEGYYKPSISTVLPEQMLLASAPED